MSRKALGRGLSALFSENASLDQDLIQVGIEQIDPTHSQPRHLFRADKLDELAASIRTSGLIQPLVVRRMGERFQLIAGERRWRAAQLAGLQRVPCVVKDVTDEGVLELSLIENLQREDLNPIEEATAYRKLLDRPNVTQEDVAKRIGKDRSSIANSLRLLRLPQEIQTLVQEDKLSMGHARALLSIESLDEQKALAREIVARGLSVRDAERIASSAAKPGASQRGPKAEKRQNPNVAAAEAKLRRKLGAPVEIKFSGKAGIIDIKFTSMDDLTRIYDLIMQKPAN